MQIMNKKLGRFNILFYFLGYIFLVQIAVTILAALINPNISINTVMLLTEIIVLVCYIKKNFSFLKIEFIIFKDNIKESFIQVANWLAWIYILNFLSNVAITFLLGIESSENQSLIVESMQGNVLITMFSIIVFAPIVEELVFRASIFSLFYKKNKTLAVILGSSIFGLMHVLVSIFSQNYVDLVYFIPYALMGYCICQCYIKSNNFIAPFLLHFINNIIGAASILTLL